MPLNAGALSSGLQSTFSSPPADAAGCAQGWATAVQGWCSSIVPPSISVAAATAALTSSLASAFATPDCAPTLESAFSAFAASVGLGMVGYAPTPPAGPVGFQSYFDGADAPTHAQAASDIAGLIDPWMKTGIATLLVTPFTVVPWS